MAHVNILSLPIEVIQLIGNVGQVLKLKSLRLVCSQFNNAFEAQVLSKLVILVTVNTQRESIDMLWMFASQNKKTSRAVQHARTLEIKYLSAIMLMYFHPRLLPIHYFGSERKDISSSPPSLIRRLTSAISSVKRRFKRKPTSKGVTALAEELMKEYLELAISSMKNLQNVRWVVQVHDPPWTEAPVIRGLAKLPQLQDLQLTLNRDSPIESSESVGRILDCLSGLKRISLSGNHVHRPRDIISGLAGLIAKSPQLVHLEVKLGYYPSIETPTLHDLLSKVPEDRPLHLTHLALIRTGICIDSFTLPHLRSLISLDLRDLPASSNLVDNADLTSERLERACSTFDICAILKQEGIYLKHVVVSDVGVFDYLCSYSGLETLDLCSMRFNSVEESNASALTFFKSVLPQLVHSLQVLKIQPMQEGQWCFNHEDFSQSTVLYQCNKLRSLTISLESTLIVQCVSFLDRVLNRYKDNLDDVIESLINLSLSLPTLSEICIVIPKLGFWNHIDPDMFYYQNFMVLVTRSIAWFSLRVGPNSEHIGQNLPDIWVDGKKLYQCQTLTWEGGEKQVYNLIYDKLALDPY